jgi:1-acyl-sn-glycerol-3-phosphate acyltransferase
MAIESGAPVVPVAMFNTAEIQPTGQIVPKVRRVEMIFGEPLYFSGDSTDLALIRSVTDQIMEAIKKISGQVYVDLYASDVKNAMAAEEAEANANEMKNEIKELGNGEAE